MASKSKALEVRCGRCGAGRGERCRGVRPGHLGFVRTHGERELVGYFRAGYTVAQLAPNNPAWVEDAIRRAL